ncbi:MAG: helix-turn-helix transcriptional regulator [Faecalibacterium sp.]|nr:helix-turn-helix transcriptional regulator [Ruminococcus sp.]MCM1392275.1 helix-turn-helix transcriptional regulator [Ruminococcus sp.]MCM1485937.1 helix-turn-helix transcriptional regulator [Faecalibacterium sp.]
MYNDTYKKPPAKIIQGKKFELVQFGYHILLSRREELGMTQQQVADAAQIHLQQYQRLESGKRNMSGASLRIALSICDVLQLDPHRFV